ncbi:DUF1365 family protein [uncultured Rhodoblastus sp.]|uniref:DUF1365 domain-containing protein n=1 Tax=uncultured Rhodoblastus sp. TaxID=543037 RepID=UPI0025D50F96|nr:DUF1365 family protein [uncultured Rhodoblastus sp.]
MTTIAENATAKNTGTTETKATEFSSLGAPALYVGAVTHRRLRPREHKLAYRIYSLLLDLDRLDELDARLKLFSLDRFNLFSFYRADRGDKSAPPKSSAKLRQRIETSMRGAGIEPDGGPIWLLTMPRLLGWAFNPISVFYCFARSGKLAAVLWEVDNTFGERHAYMIPVDGDPEDEIRQACPKDFHVSPFMNMTLDYAFRLRVPGERLNLAIDVSDLSGLLLTTHYRAHRHELTDANLLRVFFSVPLLTLRVVGGIHWEALKLWRKGIGLRPKPPPPLAPVTFIKTASPHAIRKGLSE